jgi:hypothetical protein
MAASSSPFHGHQVKHCIVSNLLLCIVLCCYVAMYVIYSYGIPQRLQHHLAVAGKAMRQQRCQLLAVAIAAAGQALWGKLAPFWQSLCRRIEHGLLMGGLACTHACAKHCIMLTVPPMTRSTCAASGHYQCGWPGWPHTGWPGCKLPL